MLKESYADNPYLASINGAIRTGHVYLASRIVKRTTGWIATFHTRGDGRINTIVHEAKDYLRRWDSPNLIFANGPRKRFCVSLFRIFDDFVVLVSTFRQTFTILTFF